MFHDQKPSRNKPVCLDSMIFTGFQWYSPDCSPLAYCKWHGTQTDYHEQFSQRVPSNPICAIWQPCHLPRAVSPGSTWSRRIPTHCPALFWLFDSTALDISAICIAVHSLGSTCWLQYGFCGMDRLKWCSMHMDNIHIWYVSIYRYPVHAISFCLWGCLHPLR